MGHGLIAWIIIGVIAGWLTGKLMKGSGFGFSHGHGGRFGRRAGGRISHHAYGPGRSRSARVVMSIIIATLGAVVLTFLLRLITGNRRREPLIG